MSVTVEVGKFYRSASGVKVGPMKSRGFGTFWGAGISPVRTDDPLDRNTGPQAYKADGSVWSERKGEEQDHLVAEWTDAPTGPVRTVTRKEIVPGEYPGRVFVTNSLDVFMGAHRRDAAELRAAIATLTEIANALETPTT